MTKGIIMRPLKPGDKVKSSEAAYSSPEHQKDIWTVKEVFDDYACIDNPQLGSHCCPMAELQLHS